MSRRTRQVWRCLGRMNEGPFVLAVAWREMLYLMDGKRETFTAQPNARRDLLLLLCLASDEPPAPQITKLASRQLASQTCKARWRKGMKSMFLKSGAHTVCPWIDLVKVSWVQCSFFRPLVLFLDLTDFYWLDLFFIPSRWSKKAKAFPVCAAQCESYCSPQHN